MIQLKLKLNSKKPTTVYAVNGKSYLLNPGSNVLNLEYEEYLSLAKALGINPVDNKKNENKVQNKEEKKPEVKDAQKEEPAKEAQAEPERVEEQASEANEEAHDKEVADPENTEAPKEDKASENKNEDEQVKESASEEIDYSTWSLKQLKAKYKEITGENCKLKKDDVISFLQEHQSNA